MLSGRAGGDKGTWDCFKIEVNIQTIKYNKEIIIVYLDNLILYIIIQNIQNKENIMKRLRNLFIALIAVLSIISISTPANAAGYYYKYNGYSGNNYQFVKSKAFINAVKKGKVTVNGKTVVNKVPMESVDKSSETIMTYSLENKKIKSKYIQRKYDSVFFLNDHLKTYAIIMPVKKGKITKQQFIKMYGKNYAEVQVIDNEISVYYKFKNHYFEGAFNKKNQLIAVSMSSHIGGQFGKEFEQMIFGK